jgi:hypothetical protein
MALSRRLPRKSLAPAPVARAVFLGMLVLWVGSAAAAHLSRAEALGLAFPGAKIERREHFLTEAQKAKVKELAGTDVPSRYVVGYEARKDGELLGVAFFDSHLVRTLPETAMVAISPKGVVLRVEVVQFHEPEEYAAPGAWTKQLEGKALTPALSLKAEIRPLSGASLTASALVDASRRCLAFFTVLYGTSPPH